MNGGIDPVVTQVDDAKGAVAVTMAVLAGDAVATLEAIMAAEDVAELEAAFAAPSSCVRRADLTASVAPAHEDEFRDFVREHEAGVRRLLRRYLRNVQDVQDAAQEVFVSMWLSWDPSRADGERRSLLVRVTRNAAIDVTRSRAYKQQRSTEHDVDLDSFISSADGPEDLCVRARKIAAVRAAINTLPQEEKALIVARRYERVPFEDLAARFGKSANALRLKEGRILRKLRVRIAEAGWPSIVPAVTRSPFWRRFQQVLSELPPAAQATILGVVLTLTASPPGAVAVASPPEGAAIRWSSGRDQLRPAAVMTTTGGNRAVPPHQARQAAAPPTAPAAEVPPKVSPSLPPLPTPSVPPVVETCEPGDPGDKITVTVPIVGMERCVSESWVPVCDRVPDLPPVASCQTEGKPSYFSPIPTPGIS